MEKYFSNKDLIKTKDETKTLLIITGTKAKITGIINVSGDVEINCTSEGELKVDGKLVILKDAKISSKITTKDVEIIGEYNGNMTSSGKVTIIKGGIMHGNVVTDRIVINEGGVFSGKVTRTDTVKNESENKVFENFKSEDEEFSIGKLKDFNKINY